MNINNWKIWKDFTKLSRKWVYITGLIFIFMIAVFMFMRNSGENQTTNTGIRTERIQIIKHKKIMQLWQDNTIVKTYRVALGKRNGKKTEKGDCKTPEGKYRITWKNNKSSCYKSIYISYPNKKDKTQALKNKVDPGGDICIHGFPNRTPKWKKKLARRFHWLINWTAGCIAVTDDEMDELWDLIPNGTEVCIVP